MPKIMLFIDGTWLYFSKARLGDPNAPDDFHLDYGKLPDVLRQQVSDQLGSSTEVEVVRTHLFGSYAWNYDLRDDEAAQRQRDFFSMLKEKYHYEVEVFPIDFRGRRLRRADRKPEDPFEPKEKCVDIALATCIMYYAAIPNVYDIAVTVVGDQDYVPVLQSVRRLGKRVCIASIQNCCCPEFSDPYDEARVKDFDILWLDDLLDNLELSFKRHKEYCQSPLHKGNRMVMTTYYPSRGEKFYCDECRHLFSQQKEQAMAEVMGLQDGTQDEQDEDEDDLIMLESTRTGQYLTGFVKTTFDDRGYGFIHGADGKDYFFHLTDLRDLEFESVVDGLKVLFEIKREPSHGRAGAAQNVRARSASSS